MDNKDLYNKNEAKQFYENRYEDNYMDDWPLEKKQRISYVIQSLQLPDYGVALDFGCGCGVFTNVIQKQLPKWKVYGCDISNNAIENAKNRFPQCSFFVSDSDQVPNIKFDFLFSHHVLEHVFDIKKIIKDINNFLKPKSFTFHVLPCGNKGSFEYEVCSMRKDGINKKMENRFFFEDEGHVRRLTTDETNKLMRKYSFFLNKEFYSNQYYGAVKWISQSHPKFILEFTNPSKGKNNKAIKFLFWIQLNFLLLFALQLPMNLAKRIKLIRNKKIYHYCLIVINLIPSLISYPFYTFINFKADEEWKSKNQSINGSEMYLIYNRK